MPSRKISRSAAWLAPVLMSTLLVLGGCVASTTGAASPAPVSEPTMTPSGAVVASPISPQVSGLPSLDPPSATFFLPDEFAPAVSYVSPDGKFVAARARNWGRVVLYRITAPSPRAPVLQLTPIAEVRGFADQISWLEDSSAVLVGTDLDPTRNLQNHDGTRAGRRIAILNIDGRVVIAPAIAREVRHHRALASPDGRWIWVSDHCCGQEVLLLSRDGTDVRRIAGPAPAGVSVGFVGWDRDGLALYSEISGDRSALVAIDVGGAERYRISAPGAYGAVGWGVVASAPDRSWQLFQLGGGIGSSFRAYHLLLGSDLRSVPGELTRSPYGPFVLGDELVYADPTGVLRAYQPITEQVRNLPLRLDLSYWPATIGISNGYFVWREALTGYVGDLKTGRRAMLPLQKTLNTSIVEGARLAEYHFNDNAIVIFDLAAIVRQ